MGQEPDPSKMPLDSSEFPDEVQVAFFMCSLLSDNWDGMSGSYMGKVWSQCPHLFEVYEVEDPRTTLYFMKLYENLLVKHRMEQAEQRRKKDERGSHQSGRTYTHNVQG